MPVTTNMWKEIERKRMRKQKETEKREGGGRELRACHVYMYAEIAYELLTPPIRPVIDTPRYGRQYPINLWPLLKLKVYVSCRCSLKRAAALTIA